MSLGIESRTPLGLQAAPGAAHPRPVSAAHRAPSPARGGQQYGAGGPGTRTQVQLSLNTAQQPFKQQQQQPRQSASPSHPSGASYAGAMTAPSAGRQSLSRTQPLERASFMGSPLSGIAGFGSPFHTPQPSPQPSPQHQQQSTPPWQHFRGPVAGVHRPNGTATHGHVTPVRAARPHSSYPSSGGSGPAQRASPHQQSYNIITHGPASPAPTPNGRIPAAWEREEKQQRHPSALEHAVGGGGRLYQSLDVEQHAHALAQSSGRRASGGSGAASQRSQSVDRGSMQRGAHRHSGHHGHHAHSHAHGHGHHHHHHPQHGHYDIITHFGQPGGSASAAVAAAASRTQASPLHYGADHPNGRASPSPSSGAGLNPGSASASAASSPHYSTMSPPDRFGFNRPADNGIRFSPNALNNSASFAQFGSTAGAGSGLGSTMSFTAPQFSSASSSPFGSMQSSPGGTLSVRPSTAASDSSDDGAGFLEVGVAEDPNPRFRPTMEDAHVVRLGDDWLNHDATARSSPNRSPGGGRGAGAGLGAGAGAGGATGRRAASLDWGSPSSSPTRRGGSIVGSTQHPQQQAQGGSRVKSGYFAIYDGHGGREAVDYIEKHLHKQLARQLREGAPPARALEAAFLDTDKAMQARGEYNESGSTVASALLRPSTSRAGQRDLFVANVGDARAVVAVQPGAGSGPGAQASPGGVRGAGAAPLKAVRLSRDHTPNDPAEADRVRRAGGAVFRGRVDGQLAVSRALGDHALRRSGVSAVPHQHHLPLTRDHKFMIVACDGLWDVITDHEAVNLIAGMTDANKMADKLVKTAMARGTTDNVSAMVVRLQK